MLIAISKNLSESDRGLYYEPPIPRSQGLYRDRTEFHLKGGPEGVPPSGNAAPS